MFYGEPRLTNDIDIVVFLKASDVPLLERAFPGEEFYCPPADVIRIEIARAQRGHFNLIQHDTGLKADIYPCADELHTWGLARAKPLIIGSDEVVLAPPEYVIVRKLQFYREGGSRKHLRDISRMVSASGGNWEPDLLQEMIRKYQLNQEWSEVLAVED